MIMVTSKKVKVVKKPKAEVVESTKPVDADRLAAFRHVSDINVAMKLGVKVIKTGSHLTVTTYPDGRQELEWDDEALLRDVRQAISTVTIKDEDYTV